MYSNIRIFTYEFSFQKPTVLYERTRRLVSNCLESNHASSGTHTVALWNPNSHRYEFCLLEWVWQGSGIIMEFIVETIYVVSQAQGDFYPPPGCSIPHGVNNLNRGISRFYRLSVHLLLVRRYPTMEFVYDDRLISMATVQYIWRCCAIPTWTQPVSLPRIRQSLAPEP